MHSDTICAHKTRTRFPHNWPFVLGIHSDVFKWKHFPRHWPFVQGLHLSPVNVPHKGRWRGALVLSLIRTWANSWANNGAAVDLIHHRANYDVTVIFTCTFHSLRPLMRSSDVFFFVILIKHTRYRWRWTLLSSFTLTKTILGYRIIMILGFLE